jgi:hypothetical protein
MVSMTVDLYTNTLNIYGVLTVLFFHKIRLLIKKKGEITSEHFGSAFRFFLIPKFFFFFFFFFDNLLHE